MKSIVVNVTSRKPREARFWGLWHVKFPYFSLFPYSRFQEMMAPYSNMHCYHENIHNTEPFPKISFESGSNRHFHETMYTDVNTWDNAVCFVSHHGAEPRRDKGIEQSYVMHTLIMSYDGVLHYFRLDLLA